MIQDNYKMGHQKQTDFNPKTNPLIVQPFGLDRKKKRYWSFDGEFANQPYSIARFFSFDRVRWNGEGERELFFLFASRDSSNLLPPRLADLGFSPLFPSPSSSSRLPPNLHLHQPLQETMPSHPRHLRQSRTPPPDRRVPSTYLSFPRRGSGSDHRRWRTGREEGQAGEEFGGEGEGC